MHWIHNKYSGIKDTLCKLHRRDNAGQKTWDEVLLDGRKKLGMYLATLKTGLNEEGVREEDLSESPTIAGGKWTFYLDMMMS